MMNSDEKDVMSLKELAERSQRIMIEKLRTEDEPLAFFFVGDEIMILENTSNDSVRVVISSIEARSDESYTYSFEGRLGSKKTGSIVYEDVAITIAVGRNRDEIYRIWQPFERIGNEIVLSEPTLNDYASRSEIGW